MRKLSKFMLTLLATLISMLPAVYVCSSQTTIFVSPKNSYPTIGASFTVNVNVAEVVNLHAWQLRITFNPEIIRCTNVSIPPDNIFGNLAMFMDPEINNTCGYLVAFCYIDSPSGVDGSGPLCQIEYNCTTPGISPITVADKMQITGTYLVDPTGTFFIPFEASDGMAEVGGLGFQENVFPVTQDSETYYVIVFSNSNVASFNYDQTVKMMTFDVSGQDGTIGFSSVVVSKELLNGTLVVLADNYAVYNTLFENATHNFICFTYAHSQKTIKILVTILGDLNGDRKVDMKDIYRVIKAYNSQPGDPNWDPICDINGDGKVDMKDIYKVIGNFGKIWVQ